MTVEFYTAEIIRLENELSEAEKPLKAAPCHPNGLVIESVRLSPEYRAAKARYNACFQAVRALNKAAGKKVLRQYHANRRTLMDKI